jgi:Uma2 family endonuclease
MQNTAVQKTRAPVARTFLSRPVKRRAHKPRPNGIKRYTYSDYVQWDDNIRRELIDGKIYLMAAPNFRHQAILMDLAVRFNRFFEGKKCRPFFAPLDVRLNAPVLKKDEKDRQNDDNVVQPDLIVLCDEDKMHKDGCHGAPDLVVEIVSPSSVSYDMVKKAQLYCEAGVREYWVVNPMNKTVTVYLIEAHSYDLLACLSSRDYSETDVIESGIFPGLAVEAAALFVYDEAGHRLA